MSPRCYQEMTVVVRELIHHHHQEFVPMKNEPFLVGKSMAFRTKYAVRFAFAQYVLDPPGGPKILHRSLLNLNDFRFNPVLDLQYPYGSFGDPATVINGSRIEPK